MNTIVNGDEYSPTFIFAHGAGAPMDSDWMNSFTEKITTKGLRVVRFEFPYMNERRETGKKRPPNSKKLLLDTWTEAIQQELKAGHQVFIGGKSMGGRMASMIADSVDVRGLICLGYPFHAPKKEPGERITHLKDLACPTLIIQGTRDTMGSYEECQTCPLSEKIDFEWLEDGDHSFKPRKKSGLLHEQHMDKAALSLFNFIKQNNLNLD